MKGKIIPIVILVFVALTTIAFRGKELNRLVGIDYIQTDFASLYHILPENANIGFSARNIDSANYIDLFFLVRYVLAPRYLSFNAKECDTVLTFFATYPNYTQFHSLVDTRKVLWAKRRDNTFFILTSTH